MANMLKYVENNFNLEPQSYPFRVENICTLEPTSKDVDIFENLNLSKLNKEEEKELMKLLLEFEDLFYKEEDKLTATSEIQHEIITTTEKPLYSKIYRYPQIHEQEIQRQINEMLEQDIIKKSNSPYNSPLWVVPKKIDNSGKRKWRIVIDYRKLNEFTVDDKFPIPNLNAILDKLGEGVSSNYGSGGGQKENSLLNSIWSLRIHSYALWS